MVTSRIDPFLYRSHETEVEKRIKRANQSSEKKNSEFAKAIELQRQKNKKLNISSNNFSRGLTEEQIHKHIGNDLDRQKIYEAAEQFEAFFVEKMFREMKKNVGKSKLIDGGFAEEIFDEMLTTERVGQLAHQQHLGLAEKIYQQLNRLI